MAARLVVTARARKDLDEIADYIIAQSGAVRAASIVQRIRSRFKKIALAPHACSLRPDLSPNRRVAVSRPYLIIYMADAVEVTVLRVLHGARDLEALQDI